MSGGIGEHVETRIAGSKAQIWSWTVDGAKLLNQRSIDLASPNAAVAISPDASLIAWESPAAARLESPFGKSQT
jgi:hypothetical protein